MRKERHKKMILAKKRNNRELRMMKSFNSLVSKTFGYTNKITLNPEE